MWEAGRNGAVDQDSASDVISELLRCFSFLEGPADMGKDNRSEAISSVSRSHLDMALLFYWR